MTREIKLQNYFNERATEINRIIKKPQNKYHPEDFHKIRVEIKKVNALFTMLENCFKEFNSGVFFKPYKSIFKKAGKVREIQVEKEVLKKYFKKFTYHEYLKYLTRSEQERRKNYFKAVNTIPKTIIRNTNKKVTGFIKKLNKKDAVSYIKKEGRKIEKITEKKEIKAKDAHQLRKGLKIFYYNLKSLELPGKKISLKRRDKLQDLLGRWHDHEVICRHVKKEIKQKRWEKTQTAALMNLKKEIVAKREDLFKKITDFGDPGS